MGGVSGAGKLRLPSWLRRTTNRRRRIQGPALIEALHGVAAASASGLDLEDALAAIVEQAKRITDTDKAILCLLVADGAGGYRVDPDTIVARGSRKQHPEEWWLARVESMAPEVLSTGHVVVEYDRGQDAWIAAAPAPSRGGPVGVLCAINSGSRSFLTDETNFLGILSAFAATALENARLAEQSRHALLVGERERIAREMHDGLAQTLFSASLGLEVCARRLEDGSGDMVERLLDVQQLVTCGLAELRSYVHDLKSPRLDRLGLAEAIRSYLTDVTEGTGREAHLVVVGSERGLDEATATCVYRVAREAVTNAVRHSGCASIHVRIEYSPAAVELSVRDDGHGFDIHAALSDAPARGSLGLRSMRERVEDAGGRTQIESAKSGTHIRARLPR